MWEQGGTTDEREKNTPTFDEITHNEIELETEVQGKIIRVYWARQAVVHWAGRRVRCSQPQPHDQLQRW